MRPERISAHGTQVYSLALAFLVSVRKAVRAFNSYRADHPLRDQAISELRDSLTVLLGLEAPLTIEVRDDGMLVAGARICPSEEIVREFGEMCFKRSIVALRFSHGIEDSELVSFLEVLSTRPQELGFAGGPRSELVEKGVTHIEVIEADRSLGVPAGQEGSVVRGPVHFERVMQALRSRLSTDGAAAVAQASPGASAPATARAETADIADGELANLLKKPDIVCQLLEQAYRLSPVEAGKPARSVDGATRPAAADEVAVPLSPLRSLLEAMISVTLQRGILSEAELKQVLTQSACLGSRPVQVAVLVEKVKGGGAVERFIGDEVYAFPPDAVVEVAVTVYSRTGGDVNALKALLAHSTTRRSLQDIAGKLARRMAEEHLDGRTVEALVREVLDEKLKGEGLEPLYLGESWRELPPDPEFAELLASSTTEQESLHLWLELFFYETAPAAQLQKLERFLSLARELLKQDQVPATVAALAEVFVERRGSGPALKIAPEVLREALKKAGGIELVHLLFDHINRTSLAGWELIMRLCAILKEDVVPSLLDRLVRTQDVYREESIIKAIVNTGPGSHKIIVAFFERNYSQHLVRLLPLVIHLPPSLSNRLLEVVYNTGPKLRETMLGVLSTMICPQAAAWLLRGMHDSEESIRHLCIVSLGAFREPRVVRHLTRFLETANLVGKDFTDAVLAIESLGKLRDSLAVPVLKRIASQYSLLHPSRSAALRQAAGTALARITETRYGV